jgi:hypothetical protein
MTTITPQQAEARLAALPTPLQDALFSKETADIIGNIGEKFNFEDAAISDVAEVVGLALLGFIHPDTVKQEIFDRVETSEESLAGVTMQIQDRILNRFRGLLVNAFYSGPGKSSVADAEAPMPIGEIPSIPAPTEGIPVVTDAPKKIDFTAPSIVSDILPVEEAPASAWGPTLTPPPEVAPPPQFMMEDIQAAGAFGANPSANLANNVEKYSPSVVIAESRGSLTDIPRQAREMNNPPPPAPEAPPAPFIMREEATPEPAIGNINIGSAFGVDSSDQFQKEGASRISSKPQVAQVEFGNLGTASSVDYSSFAPEGDVPAPPGR